jgi:hypothetical protein
LAPRVDPNLFVFQLEELLEDVALFPAESGFLAAVVKVDHGGAVVFLAKFLSKLAKSQKIIKNAKDPGFAPHFAIPLKIH